MKQKTYSTEIPKEQAFLIGFPNDQEGLDVSFEELKALADTAGLEIVRTLEVKLRDINPATYVGSGKVKEIKELGAEFPDLHLFIFDTELTNAQHKNLEDELQAKIMDRTGLILEIFAQRARTREGKLQVECAQLAYLLPRLTGMWSHLSRQYAGAGTKGPGETQLELDKRKAHKRLQHLREELETVRKDRTLQRKARQKSRETAVALVGYTNAGKSTLMNALTGADVLVENKLFATLDPTSRVYLAPNNERFIFIDTVGFIRHLPHTLVEAFKATLEEAEKADVIVHVADASAPDTEEQIEAVNNVLTEIGAQNNPRILVLNKKDMLSFARYHELKARFPEAIFISAKEKDGFKALMDEIVEKRKAPRPWAKLILPPDRGDLVAKLYARSTVRNLSYDEDAIRLEAEIPKDLRAEYFPYREKNKEEES